MGEGEPVARLLLQRLIRELQPGSGFAFTKLSWSGFALCFGMGPCLVERVPFLEKRRHCAFREAESPSHHLSEVRGSGTPGPAVLRSFWEREEQEAR